MLLEQHNFVVDQEMYSLVSRRVSLISRGRLRLSTSTASEWMLFPNNREGDEFTVNWSLNEDGITPIGDAFRNARVNLLTTRLDQKVSGGKVELNKPVYTGNYSLKESGDSVSHDVFSQTLKSHQDYLSSGVDLFVEDAGLGASSSIRVGVRVVSESPALALIARSLLVRKFIFESRFLPSIVLKIL